MVRRLFLPDNETGGLLLLRIVPRKTNLKWQNYFGLTVKMLYTPIPDLICPNLCPLIPAQQRT